MRVRRRRIGKIILAGVLLVLVLLGGSRLLRYTLFYDRNLFYPASLESPSPTYFYFDWRRDWSQPEHLRAEVADDGVVRSRRDRPVAGTVRHNPLRVIQAALAVHDLLREDPTPDREAFFRRQLKWLVGEGAVVLADDTMVWPHYDRFARYGLEGPWISALTQGQAISLLVRAADYTGEERYLVAAERAIRAFGRADLRLVWRGSEGEVFLEEFPCDPPSHALNGCLLAWLGIWDYVRATGDPEWERFARESLQGIQRVVPEFEVGNWTVYDLHQQRPTSPAYHELHASLAEALFAITGDPFWEDRARRWGRASASPLQRFLVAGTVLLAKIRARVSPGEPDPRGVSLAAPQAGESQ